MSFIKQIILSKLKNVREAELLAYSRQYQFDITQPEAAKIAAYLKTHQIDPFTALGRAGLIRELAVITNPETAKKANQLFLELIRSNGVEHLFN